MARHPHEAPALSNADALEAIVNLMSGTEWDSQTASDIADLCRRAGYDIAEPDDDDWGPRPTPTESPDS